MKTRPTCPTHRRESPVHRAPTHVAAALKAETGYAAGDWIRAGRVSAAADRLAHTDASLDEIAAAGFTDVIHTFSEYDLRYHLEDVERLVSETRSRGLAAGWRRRPSGAIVSS